jgi:hypothetical protein
MVESKPLNGADREKISYRLTSDQDAGSSRGKKGRRLTEKQGCFLGA